MERSDRYSGISTVNHWITVILVIAMLVLGIVAGEATSEAAEDYVIGVHISLGFFAFLFIAWRIGYRLYDGFQPALPGSAAERRIASVVHRSLLVILALQVITGPLYLFTEGESMNVFGWFSIHLPLESLAALHEPVEEIHEIIGAVVLPLLLILHIAGAIKHYLGKEQAEDS